MEKQEKTISSKQVISKKFNAVHTARGRDWKEFDRGSYADSPGSKIELPEK